MSACVCRSNISSDGKSKLSLSVEFSLLTYHILVFHFFRECSGDLYLVTIKLDNLKDNILFNFNYKELFN